MKVSVRWLKHFPNHAAPLKAQAHRRAAALLLLLLVPVGLQTFCVPQVERIVREVKKVLKY
jgi:hypothetical protein